MSDCGHYRQELGAYVLDGLAADEARALEAHMEQCGVCRAENAELAGLLPLLDLARDAPPEAPMRVRDRVIAQVARRRGRRRWLAAVAAAALAGVLLGGAVAWQLAPAEDELIVVPLEGAEAFEADGWAAFRPHDERVVVELELDGLEPLPEPAVYEAWLSTHGDRVLSIGQFETDQDGSVTASLSADGPMEAYQGFWITAEPDRRDPAHDGPTVLSAPVPPAR